jgi:hypothetical protein
LFFGEYNREALNSKFQITQTISKSHDQNSKQYGKGDKSKIKNLSPKFIGAQRAK